MKFGSLRSTSVSGLTGGNGGPSKLFTNRSNSARAAKMRDIAKQIEQMRIIQNQRSEKSSPATSSSGGGCNTINTTSGPTSSGSTSPSNSAVAHPPPPVAPPVEQVQHQVQIRDLKTISMNTSSSNSNSDHHTSMLAKLQNVMNGETNGATFLNRSSPKQRKV